ncbi:F-box domain containing protein [Trema orientale]|uniref:F-box domain containing protein n=1 Tax=Trema orientale TaxID=63057 RepID=A0A2P5CU26_TREOI|nr:F-box domain containing protein [Trema orientale]
MEYLSEVSESSSSFQALDVHPRVRNCDQSRTAPPPWFSYGAGAPNAKRLCPNPNSDQNHNRKEGAAAINRFFLLKQVPEEVVEEILLRVPATLSVQEVVEEILLRVPADSLKICKRVCKSWFDMINRPSFVNKHLVRNRVSTESKKMTTSSHSKSFFLKWIREDENIDTPPPLNDHHHANDLSKLELSLVTISEEEEEEDNDDGDRSDHLPCVIERVNLPPVPAVADQQRKPFPSDFRVTHCNGIIHMFDHYRDWTALLLNPALAQFKLLQDPPDLPLELDTFIGCGFGYDSYEGNYLFLNPKSVCCRGAYYWLNVPRTKHDELLLDTRDGRVVSYNLCAERLRTVPLPGAVFAGFTSASSFYFKSLVSV